MRLNLFEDKSNIDEHVDLYFKEMNPVVRQIIDTVNAERPVLTAGRRMKIWMTEISFCWTQKRFIIWISSNADFLHTRKMAYFE